MFVVIEGVEGSGKSTLVRGLVERFGVDGREVIVSREPGGTALGDAVRTIFLDRTLTIAPLTEAFLITASRAQHVDQVIRPALEANRLVLCDRFTDSTIAYQGYGRGLDLGVLKRLNDEATGGLAPDLTLLIDLPVDVALTRMEERSYDLDRIERADRDFHERVRQGYLELAKLPKHQTIDGTKPVDQVLNEAWNFISTP